MLKGNFDYQQTNDLHQFLSGSNNWLILRIDETGLHLHCKNEDDIALIPLFLGSQDEFWDFTKKEVWKIKKQNQ